MQKYQQGSPLDHLTEETFGSGETLLQIVESNSNPWFFVSQTIMLLNTLQVNGALNETSVL